MLLSARVAPSLANYAQLRYAYCQPLFMKSFVCKNSLTYSTLGKEQQKRFNNIADIGGNPIHSSVRHNMDILTRWSSTRSPNLPSKSEVEKTFFKITVVLWDTVSKIIAWTWAMFRTRIIFHPQVQSKWKTFNERLEAARKDM